MNLFNYEFMRLAFVAGILLAIILPLVGSSTVYQRLSMSGDALAHSSLAGVAIGLASGWSPLAFSIIFCVVSFLIMELLRKRFPRFSELGVAIVLSLGIGLAGILSSFVPSANFDAYLFGSILLVGWDELIAVIVLFIAVLGFYSFFYWRIFAGLFDSSEAVLQGLKPRLMQFFQSLLTALTIAVASKIIGSLVVSSLLVIPVATAMTLNKGYKATLFWSVFFSFVAMAAGLVFSFYWNLRPGASIVIVSLLILFANLVANVLVKSINKKREKTIRH